MTVSMNRIVTAALCAALALVFGCGNGGEGPYEVNLLKNSSFEKVGSDGVPEGWTIEPFRGLEGADQVRYGVDEGSASDGEKSFYFAADPGTRRWFVLSQEVKVEPATHVQLRGWMQLDQVTRNQEQYAQCNFMLTFLDENHTRFQELRFADKRTRLRIGTIPWYEEAATFRMPRGTRYVVVSCLLGMEGTAWFDNVRLSLPKPVEWLSSETQNFVFHWLPEKPFPAGSMENQQRMFDQACQLLDLESDVKISYYLYPDTSTIRSMLSLKGYQYASWDDVEFHSINPNDNHEFIHMITDEYGVPPRAIAEGLVYYLLDDWGGKPVKPQALELASRGALPGISKLINYNEFVGISLNQSMPAAATLVGYLVESYGAKKLMDFFRELNGVNSAAGFDIAVQRVYGFDSARLQQGWVNSLGRVELPEKP